MEPLSVDELLSQGMCCGYQCSNCPYMVRGEGGATEKNAKWIEWKKMHKDGSYNEYQLSLKSL